MSSEKERDIDATTDKRYAITTRRRRREDSKILETERREALASRRRRSISTKIQKIGYVADPEASTSRDAKDFFGPRSSSRKTVGFADTEKRSNALECLRKLSKFSEFALMTVHRNDRRLFVPDNLKMNRDDEDKINDLPADRTVYEDFVEIDTEYNDLLRPEYYKILPTIEMDYPVSSIDFVMKNLSLYLNDIRRRIESPMSDEQQRTNWIEIMKNHNDIVRSIFDHIRVVEQYIFNVQNTFGENLDLYRVNVKNKVEAIDKSTIPRVASNKREFLGNIRDGSSIGGNRSSVRVMVRHDRQEFLANRDSRISPNVVRIADDPVSNVTVDTDRNMEETIESAGSRVDERTSTIDSDPKDLTVVAPELAKLPFFRGGGGGGSDKPRRIQPPRKGVGKSLKSILKTTVRTRTAPVATKAPRNVPRNVRRRGNIRDNDDGDDDDGGGGGGGGDVDVRNAVITYAFRPDARLSDKKYRNASRMMRKKDVTFRDPVIIPFVMVGDEGFRYIEETIQDLSLTVTQKKSILSRLRRIERLCDDPNLVFTSKRSLVSHLRRAYFEKVDLIKYIISCGVEVGLDAESFRNLLAPGYITSMNKKVRKIFGINSDKSMDETCPNYIAVMRNVDAIRMANCIVKNMHENKVSYTKLAILTIRVLCDYIAYDLLRKVHINTGVNCGGSSLGGYEIAVTGYLDDPRSSVPIQKLPLSKNLDLRSCWGTVNPRGKRKSESEIFADLAKKGSLPYSADRLKRLIVLYNLPNARDIERAVRAVNYTVYMSVYRIVRRAVEMRYGKSSVAKSLERPLDDRVGRFILNHKEITMSAKREFDINLLFDVKEQPVATAGCDQVFDCLAAVQPSLHKIINQVIFSSREI